MEVANGVEKGSKSYFRGNKGNQLQRGDSLRFFVTSLLKNSEKNDKNNSLGNL